MSSLVELFLSKMNRTHFVTIDFQHYLNRKGLNLSDKYADRLLTESGLVARLPDGRWERLSCL